MHKTNDVITITIEKWCFEWRWNFASVMCVCYLKLIKMVPADRVEHFQISNHP